MERFLLQILYVASLSSTIEKSCCDNCLEAINTVLYGYVHDCESFAEGKIEKPTFIFLAYASPSSCIKRLAKPEPVPPPKEL